MLGLRFGSRCAKLFVKVLLVDGGKVFVELDGFVRLSLDRGLGVLNLIQQI